ncbi:MAG: redox-sensing transcriptional repressor Rex [Clostridiales bacterium]|jgi:redox-sensing transcriptional repressor|nr:redox-sensing transcriptional repressor Rex [Clostridiales bacterium]
MSEGVKKISAAVIKRLPRYLRVFKEFEANGIETISSEKTAAYMGVTASQIRQDFCRFGCFGQRKCGYDVTSVVTELSRIIGLTKRYDMIIVGAGNIGRALANYNGFKEDGFYITALFDICGEKDDVNGVPVYPAKRIEKYITENGADAAVIAVPKEQARAVLDRLISAGIKYIWNFAPVELYREGVTIENIGIGDSLFLLCYYMNHI